MTERMTPKRREPLAKWPFDALETCAHRRHRDRAYVDMGFDYPGIDGVDEFARCLDCNGEVSRPWMRDGARVRGQWALAYGPWRHRDDAAEIELATFVTEGQPTDDLATGAAESITQ